MSIKRLLIIALLLTFTFAMATAASGNGLPSGERTLGQSTLEPAYNDGNGTLIFLLTPFHTSPFQGFPVHSNPTAWAPIFVVVYPTSAAASVGTLNCMHLPTENCPDHGDAVAGAAATIKPAVYGGGVVGHDHLLDVPGGEDFNIAWEPVLVLFTNSTAANEHITTEAQLDAALARGDVIEIPVPQGTFNCSVVPAITYDQAVPVN